MWNVMYSVLYNLLCSIFNWLILEIFSVNISKESGFNVFVCFYITQLVTHLDINIEQ